MHALGWLLAVLGVLVGAVWGASAWFEVSLRGRPFNRSWSVAGGQVIAEWFRRGSDGSVSGFGNPGWRVRRRPGGVGVSFDVKTRTLGPFRAVHVPIWPLGLACGCGMWWALARAQRLERIGACAACGYPRMGLPTDAACPECGAAAGGTLVTKGVVHVDRAQAGDHYAGRG